MGQYINLRQTANPQFQHIINKSTVFHYLRKNGPTYRNVISSALGISLPTVTGALDSLTMAGFAELVEYRKNNQARRVPYYQITMKDSIILSIDLLKNIIATFDTNGITIMQNFTFPPDDDPEKRLLQIINNFVRRKLKKERSSIKSICIGFPGIVDVEKGMVIKAIYHPNLENIPFKQILKEEYNCTVFIDNVVNLAAYANYSEFNKIYKNIVSCDIGMEIGTGLLINGTVYYGENYIAGEIGFYTDNLENPAINFKRKYTFRALCAEFVKCHEGKIVDPAKLDVVFCLEKIAELFTLAHKKDKLVLKLVDTYIQNIALMLNKVEVLLNPKIIVISGDICQIPYSEEVFLNPLNQYFKAVRLMAEDIKYSKYGSLVSVYGAGEMALDNYFSEEFPYVMGF